MRWLRQPVEMPMWWVLLAGWLFLTGTIDAIVRIVGWLT